MKAVNRNLKMENQLIVDLIYTFLVRVSLIGATNTALQEFVEQQQTLPKSVSQAGCHFSAKRVRIPCL